MSPTASRKLKHHYFSYLFVFSLFFYYPIYSSNIDLSDSYESVLYRWEPSGWDNFGDALSQPIAERILGKKIKRASSSHEKRLLALGSILHCAKNGDSIWGSGIKTGWFPDDITQLDVRAVRGPLTRNILLSRDIECPPVYGDPALLIPLLFPEFELNQVRDYIMVPHHSEIELYRTDPNFVSPKEPWEQVVRKITESKFVIASSLHGIIVAESFGIPARMIMMKNPKQFFKFQDYYLGTGRPNFQYATSVEQALQMGGEPLPVCDLQELLNSFPYDYWD